MPLVAKIMNPAFLRQATSVYALRFSLSMLHLLVFKTDRFARLLQAIPTQNQSLETIPTMLFSALTMAFVRYNSTGRGS